MHIPLKDRLTYCIAKNHNLLYVIRMVVESTRLERLRRMKTADKVIVLFALLIIAAVLSFLVIYFNKPAIPNSHRGSLNPPQPAPSLTAAQTVSGNPSLIAIPSLGLNLEVIHGWEDTKGNWTLTPDKAQYAIISPEPNNHEGNTLIYGHALTNIFGRLYLMQKGAAASITTDNGYVFHYVYEGTYAVNPHDWSVFEYKGAPILTLQTCSGTFYQNRQMYQFNLLSVDKITQS